MRITFTDILVFIGLALCFVASLVGEKMTDLQLQVWITLLVIGSYETACVLIWGWSDLYTVTPDVIKSDEESKLVPLDYVKFLLGMRL